METKFAAEILAHFEDHKAEMKAFLEQLVTFESPSRDRASQVEILEFLEGYFKKIGFFATQIPGKKTGGYLYARPRKRDKNKPVQLLLGHCDTVWESGTLKTMPIAQKNGQLTGPGIYDMKAGLTQIVFSLKAIGDLSLSTGVCPIVLINSDEEIGSRESSNTIKRLAKIAQRAFVMEPPLGLDGRLKTARKGLGRFTITVKGKGAHAGLDPEKGINAIVELSHQIQQLFAMNDFERGITVNVGTIEGGISPNVIAPESKAVVDVRVLTQEDGEVITEKINGLKPSIPNVEVLVEGGMGRSPMERTDRNQKLWEMARTHALSLGLELNEATAGGGSDGNTTSAFTATLDGLGTPGDGAHADHEFVYLDKLPERTALLTLLILSDPMIN